MKSYVLFLSLLIFSCRAFSEPYYWIVDNWSDTRYSSLSAACDSIATANIKCVAGPVVPYYNQYVMSVSQIYALNDGHHVTSMSIYRWGDSCPDGAIYNPTAGSCGHDSQKGTPPILACQGNPINIAVGNKFQTERDIELLENTNMYFERFYNSLDGLWLHTFSSHIRIAMGQATLVMSDGQELNFILNKEEPINSTDGLGYLRRTISGWSYSSPGGDILYFDSEGLLIKMTDKLSRNFLITRSGTALAVVLTVIDDLGRKFMISEDSKFQPVRLVSDKKIVNYLYDEKGHLVKAITDSSGQQRSRSYLYESPYGDALLTSKVDERGITTSTWVYNSAGQAISSIHAGGVDSTSISYNGNAVIVTNAKGKVSKFNFLNIGSRILVSSIIGESSDNCPSSNSSYTYNNNGQILTKTDAKGYITTYTYNERGLEVSRTEASSTPQARTIITTWDPTYFLRTQIIEPTRTIMYTYDAQGRTLSQQVTAH
jgi:YD repeat-containing protein